MLNLTDENKEEVLNDENIIALDFYGDHCGPCKKMFPIYDEIDKELLDVTFYKVDVSLYREIALEYGVRSIPTVIFIKNKEVLDKLVGTFTKEEIYEKIESL